MDNSIVYHIINILLSCVLTFVVSFVGTKIIKDRNRQSEEYKQIKDLSTSLSAITLYRLFSDCKELGYRTSTDTIAFRNLAQPYFAIGGDGYIHDIEKQFYELPLNDEAKKQ